LSLLTHTSHLAYYAGHHHRLRKPTHTQQKMAPPPPPPSNSNNNNTSELLLLPKRAAPRPVDLRAALGRAPIPFLFSLQPPRPPLSYYGRRCVRACVRVFACVVTES
jgi:hypothetical protein